VGPLGSNKELAEAAECMAQRGLTQEGAPALIRLITQVATRFGIPVTEKVMAQSVRRSEPPGRRHQPAVHRSFPGCRAWPFHRPRLERVHGAETVKAAYLGLARG